MPLDFSIAEMYTILLYCHTLASQKLELTCLGVYSHQVLTVTKYLFLINVIQNLHTFLGATMEAAQYTWVLKLASLSREEHCATLVLEQSILAQDVNLPSCRELQPECQVYFC